MRFLIGIIIGAILTLFIATAVDAPTHPAFDQLHNQFAGVWDDLIDTTSDSLFPTPEMPPNPDGSETSETLENKMLTAALERPADRPVTALSAPEPLPPSPPADASVVADARPGNGVEVPIENELPELPELPELAELAELAELSELRERSALAEPSPATIWEPFHSQMSAEGFAKLLSRELDHSFRVERQGAGAYQVVFDVNSQGERDLLFAQIAEITGQ